MARLTITLTDIQLEKIKVLAEQKSMTLSHCASHLIDLSLHVEETNRQLKLLADHAPTSSSNIQLPNQQWQTLLTWTLESRYLMRYLTLYGFQESPEHRDAIVAKAKQKASNRVNQMIKDTQG